MAAESSLQHSSHAGISCTGIPCTGNDPVNGCIAQAGHVVPEEPEMCPTGTECYSSGTGQLPDPVGGAEEPSISPERHVEGSVPLTDGDGEAHTGGRDEHRCTFSHFFLLHAHTTCHVTITVTAATATHSGHKARLFSLSESKTTVKWQ